LGTNFKDYRKIVTFIATKLKKITTENTFTMRIHPLTSKTVFSVQLQEHTVHNANIISKHIINLFTKKAVISITQAFN